MATRIAVMNDGRIQQIGTPSEIYYRPRSRFVADFIGESNFLDVDGRRAATASPGSRTGAPFRARRTAGSGRGTGDADGAARVDPRRRPGRARRTASLRGTDRADVVPREPDADRGRAATRVEAPLTASQFGRERIAAARPHPGQGGSALVGRARRSAVAEQVNDEEEE